MPKKTVDFVHVWNNGDVEFRTRTVEGETEGEIASKIERAKRISPHCVKAEVKTTTRANENAKPLNRSGNTR